ncbi:MAG: NADH-quinone oxidoreductase subunit M [Chloroflexi bacterium]|nr:NADH-quinone oxidoreductase subunit M [Chloroflexota bacterium]
MFFEDLGNNLLTVLVFLPVLGAAVVALLPKDQPTLARWVALILSLPPAILAIGLFIDVLNADPSATGFYHEYTTEWFPQIGASWTVGVDGISMSMVLLTAILSPLGILIAFEHINNPRAVLALLLLLETAMIGVFVTLDMLAFFVFWELGLVPMYFLINQWGGANREYASMKFFIYTMAGSLGLLLAIQMIAWTVGDASNLGGPTFDLATWYNVWPSLGRDSGEILGFSYGTVKYYAFLAFFIAFAIKIPVWPFHTWLPDAHTEAPTAGSMLLAGVLLKQGAYGFIRFVIPLFPQDFAGPRELLGVIDFSFAEVFAILAMLGIVLGAFGAWAQDDLKKLVAYSSVNHMGFVVLGLAAGAMMYGALWAQSIDEPDMALSMINQELNNDDLLEHETYARFGTVDNLSSTDRRDLATLKLNRLREEGVLPRNEQSALVAMNGAVLQMFNHGLSSAAMFLLVGALYHKAHTRDLRRFGGLWHIIPVFGFLFVFTSMASLGLPGLNGFTSEWLVVSGAFPLFPIIVLVSMIGLLMTGAYILKGIQKVLHGPVNPDWLEYHEHHHSLEINLRETIAVAPLVVLMLVTGLYPNWILEVINASVTQNIFAVFTGG